MAQQMVDRAVLVATDSTSDVDDVHVAVSFARRRRRAVVGGALGLGVASALVLWRSAGRCEDGARFEESVVSLAETYPEELGQLADPRDDLDARRQWLAEAGEARRQLQRHKLATGETRLPAEVQQEIDAAMQSEDPVQARKLVDRAMARAIAESKTKRRELKSYIKGHRRGLKGKKDEPSASKQVALATCVFDVLSATTTVAGILTNLNDATKTCWGVKPKDLFDFSLKGRAYVHTNVCSVNVWALLGGIIGLSSTLSSAASDCASTMIPNVDAMCSATITGVVTAMAGMGGASTLVSAACHPKGWYHDIAPGSVPSNVGSNDAWVAKHPERQAQYNAEMAQQRAGDLAGARRLEGSPAAAPARQLLFGGGKDATAAQCSVEIAGTMWALASAAMAINSLGNQEEGGSCPPKNFLTGSERPSNNILYKVPQALCTVDVTSALLSFFGAATYIQLAVVNCLDTLNLGAICGSGITGLLASSAGVAQAASGMYVACDVAQKKPIKKVINLGRTIDTSTNGMLSGLIFGSSSDGGEANASPFGRRLSEDEHLVLNVVEENIRELQQRFKTPQEALLSIGVDLEDKHAPWRNATAPGVPSLSDLTGLAELVQRQQPKKTASLFGGETC